MATYRVIDPRGTVVETREINSAGDAHAWFVDQKANYHEPGWTMEVRHDPPDGEGEWHFFELSEG